jgi:hypothetical protein
VFLSKCYILLEYDARIVVFGHNLASYYNEGIILKRVLDIDNLLKTLPYAADAPFNTAKWQHEPTCLPDTRVDL